MPIDRMDAMKVAKGVAVLPDKHRRAVHWHYLHPCNPLQMARELGLSLQDLADMVLAARQILINRGI